MTKVYDAIKEIVNDNATIVIYKLDSHIIAEITKNSETLCFVERETPYQAIIDVAANYRVGDYIKGQDNDK